MNLGYSTDFIAMIPDGLTVTATPDGKVTIAGIDKESSLWGVNKLTLLKRIARNDNAH